MPLLPVSDGVAVGGYETSDGDGNSGVCILHAEVLGLYLIDLGIEVDRPT